MDIIRFTPSVKTHEDALKVFCSKSIKIPYSTEMVYLPYLLFAYSISQSFITGKKNTSRGLFLVDLVQGLPMNIKNKTMFEISPALEKEMKALIGDFPVGQNKKNPLSIDREDIDEEKILPALMDDEEAISKGRKLFMYDVMKFSGSFRKAEITALEERKRIYYPYWLIYYKDRKGTTAFSVFDALNRNRESGDLKRSINLALVKKHHK
jgi:hypothetical protein